MLHRRDGVDLFLGLYSWESVRSALGVLARQLVSRGVGPERMALALIASLPWASFLRAEERAEFLRGAHHQCRGVWS